MKRLATTLIACACLAQEVQAQADTIYAFDKKRIAAQVKEGTSHYAMFFQNKKKPKRAGSFWVSQSVKFKTVNGIEAIAIEQKMYSSDTSAYNYVYSLVRRDNFNPIHHRTWRQRSGVEAFDFYSDKIVGSDSVLNNAKKGFIQATNKPTLNWEVDLFTFSLLKLEKNKSYFMNFYHPGSPTGPKLYEYKVVGEETIKGADDQSIPCWKLKIVYSETSNAIFFISKKTNQVIKLEEDFGSGVRYKVRLPGDLLVR
jgi:hypothetical protein